MAGVGATLGVGAKEGTMRTVILGAAGLIGRALARQVAGAPGFVSGLVLADRVAAPVPGGAAVPVRAATGDVCDEAFVAELVREADCIVHLAATLAADAEADLLRGTAVNLHAPLRLLELCRAKVEGGGAAVRFVFTSSIAAFGGALPEVVDDTVPRTPQTSYGTHKAVLELMIDDATRRGALDGRTLRLPVVLVRPGGGTAVSDRVAALVREPVLGRDVACGLHPGTRLVVASARRVASALHRLMAVPAAALGPGTRAMNLPSLSVTAAELAAAAEGCGVARPGRVSWVADPALQLMLDSWPRRFTSVRAAALGLEADASAAAIVRGFMEDEGLA